MCVILLIPVLSTPEEAHYFIYLMTLILIFSLPLGLNNILKSLVV